MYKCLEVGPGAGKYKFNPRAPVKCEYVLFIDLERPQVKLKTWWDWVVAEISYLPIRDSIFDEVHAHHVLEHSLDVVRAIYSLRRVTRKGGEICITVPNKFSRIAYEDPTHRHFLSFLDLIKFKKVMGVKHMQVSWSITDLLPEKLRKLICLVVGLVLKELRVEYKVS